jgi:hypothetical protein
MISRREELPRASCASSCSNLVTMSFSSINVQRPDISAETPLASECNVGRSRERKMGRLKRLAV